MKKTLNLALIMLVIILCLSLMAGCGTGAASSPKASTAAPTASAPGTEVPATEPDPTPESDPEPEAVFPLAESVTFSAFIEFPPPFAAFIEDWNDNYGWIQMEKLTNVHIDFMSVSTETVVQTYNVMAASGDYADIISGVGRRQSGGLAAALEQEIIVDLTTLDKSLYPNLSAIFDANPEYYKKALTDDGKLGFFPQMYSQDRTGWFGPCIRQDWLDALGLEAPVTYDDYHDVLTAFKTEYSPSDPLVLFRTGVSRYNYLLAGFGVAGDISPDGTISGAFYNDNGTVKFGIMQDGFKEYLTLMNTWYNEGLISQNFVSNESDNQNPPNEILTTGNAGIWIGKSIVFPEWTNNASDENFHVMAITDAVKNAGDKNHLSADQSAWLGQTDGWSIGTTCEDIELCCQYLDYFYSPEGHMAANYGIEGESYTLDDDGNAVYTELVTNNQDGISFGRGVGIFSIQGGGFMVDWTREEQTYNDDQKAARGVWTSVSDNANGISVTLNAAESEVVAQLWGDIGTYCSENILKFITGSNNLDSDWDTFIAQLQNHKIDEVVAQYQSAYDRIYK